MTKKGEEVVKGRCPLVFGCGKEGKGHGVVGPKIGPTPTLPGSTVQKLLGPFHAWRTPQSKLLLLLLFF